MERGGPQALASVRETAVRLVAEHRLPGLGVAVVGPEGPRLLETVGFADLEARRSLSPRDRHRIGSVTKTMVGLCALALCERGKLSLDARVRELLPEVSFRGPADDLRLRHLLTHTGGIGEAPTEAHLRQPERALWADSAEEVPRFAEQYPDGITIEVTPGAKWAYANHGWVLVGEIVARVEGASIEQVLERRIFAPLGRSDSDLLDQPHPALTRGYHRPPSHDARELMERAGLPVPDEPTVDGINIRGRYQWIRGRAAGSVQATLADLARYAQALLRRGEGIVSPATFDRMLEPQYRVDPRLAQMGLAFFREPCFGRLAFGHNGGVTGGWNTALKAFPEHDFAVVIHQNLSYDHFADVEHALLHAALGAPDPKRPQAELDPSLLQGAPGLYEAPPGALTNVRVSGATGRVRVSARGGALWLESRRGPWKHGVRMRPCDPDDPTCFELETGDLELTLVVLLQRSGRVEGLCFDRRVRMQRAENPE
jgi:D-alanyl-D-alanine carboxypeptidase